MGRCKSILLVGGRTFEARKDYFYRKRIFGESASSKFDGDRRVSKLELSTVLVFEKVSLRRRKDHPGDLKVRKRDRDIVSIFAAEHGRRDNSRRKETRQFPKRKHAESILAPSFYYLGKVMGSREKPSEIYFFSTIERRKVRKSYGRKLATVRRNRNRDIQLFFRRIVRR